MLHIIQISVSFKIEKWIGIHMFAQVDSLNTIQLSCITRNINLYNTSEPFAALSAWITSLSYLLISFYKQY